MIRCFKFNVCRNNKYYWDLSLFVAVVQRRPGHAIGITWDWNNFRSFPSAVRCSCVWHASSLSPYKQIMHEQRVHATENCFTFKSMAKKKTWTLCDSNTATLMVLVQRTSAPNRSCFLSFFHCSVVLAKDVRGGWRHGDELCSPYTKTRFEDIGSKKEREWGDTTIMAQKNYTQCQHWVSRQ